MNVEKKIYDSIIIGGGPAGLSAAMHLHFQQRKILVLDRRTSPMNFYTNPVHNYPGVKPLVKGREILRKLRADANLDDGVIMNADVTQISGKYPNFKIKAKLRSASQDEVFLRTKTLLLATGVARKHPKVQSNWRKWLPYAGRDSISFYCPDCEAPLTMDKDILVVNAGTVNAAIYIANYIAPFARRVRIFMTEDAYIPLADDYAQKLDASGFEWHQGNIEKVVIKKPLQVQELITTTGKKFTCNQFFVTFIAEPRSELAKQVGVTTDSRNCVITDHRGKTNVEGIWAAGDVRAITQSVAMAVGTGNYAAIMINKLLERKSFHGTEIDHPEERFLTNQEKEEISLTQKTRSTD